MSPEERQMLADLFERVRSQANAPRDRDAESFIGDAVRAQPYAPYLLAQAVLVQEQALHGADQKIQDLQAQIGQLQAQAQSQSQSQSQAQPQGAGSFLGGLFGGAPRQAPQTQPAPSPWGAAPQQPSYAPPPPPANPSPWGAPQPQQPQGGGFLRNAMGAAAGVAGGVLLADSLRGLFGGGHGAGLLGGGAAGSGTQGGETIVNNFFDTPKSEQTASQPDSSNNDGSNYSDADYMGDDDYSGGDDDFSSDV